jgi:hypothetical protein
LASEVDVYNLALTLLDLSDVVHSPNDQSQAAAVCKRFYTFSRKKVLETAHWSFATKMPALALKLDQTTLPLTTPYPYPGWRYVYARPLDALRMLAVTTQYGLRVNPWPAYWWNMAMGPTANTWGPFRPPWDEVLDQISVPNNQAVDIVTDQSQAYGVYVADVTNVDVWSHTFRETVAWELATKIAGPLSANENAKKNAEQNARLSITTALALNLNEKQPDPYPDSPAITCRN